MYQPSGSTFIPGTVIGDVWEVEIALGKGGMGSVYRCHNRHAGRIKAAIKLLDPAFQFHPEAKARFLREAEILFTIEHPNVVKVSNVHLNASPPFLEMEYIEGDSLENELAGRGAVPLATALRRCRKLADALAYLHRKGIFHRDIKPDNILIREEDGEPKIVDFGLAMERGARRITQQGQQHFGTVSYCPPEWMQAETVDPIAWDCYALGVVFYEMLTGTVGFPMSRKEDPRRQVILVMTQKQTVEYLDPGPKFQPELRDLVRRMTMKERKGRLVDANEVARVIDALDPEWEATETGEAEAADGLGLIPDPTPGTVDREEAPTLYAVPPARSARRRPLALAALGLFVGATAGIAVLAALWWGYSGGPRSRDAVVRVAGIDPSWPVSIAIEDLPASRVEGSRHHFEAVPVGQVYARYAIGDGCDAMVEDLPSTCLVDSTVLRIEPGEGPASLFLEVEPPSLRPVTVAVGTAPATVALDGRTLSVQPDGDVRFEGVRPGRHSVAIRAGACEPGCVGDACGPTCAYEERELVVSVGAGALEARFPVSAPAPPVEAEPVAAVPVPVPRPSPVAAPAPAGVPARVTGAAFGAWLQSHPAWVPDQAIAEGRAEDSYLASAPERRPSGSGAAVEVPYAAAFAYCATRGGLRRIDDEPHTWSGTPLHEWRQGPGGSPMWRRFDGATSDRVRSTEAHMQTGFRCTE
ncbi:MAG: serine/threonine protein kinase [Alphaproteobacteria bacterium]|nr:serine/threonine protein kinase [Alphaproteobacteria bacterium]